MEFVFSKTKRNMMEAKEEKKNKCRIRNKEINRSEENRFVKNHSVACIICVCGMLWICYVMLCYYLFQGP